MIHLIPRPAFYEEKYGEFVLNSTTAVYADPPLEAARDYFVQSIEKACGIRPAVVVSDKAAIRFLYDVRLPKEGYRLECTSERIIVQASSHAGALYAGISIRQLMLAELMDHARVLTMHAVVIEDKPRYEWRGLLLDESRNFFGPVTVKRLLDMMAYHKLNVLHWHLTDNEGWRIESKKYPELTEVGSKRKGTQIKAWGKKDVEWIPYDGYYTQAEIKEIVAYAERLNIMIVPEIDMPAHLGAAIASYPELSCRKLPMEVPILHNDPNCSIIACAGDDFTFKFAYDIIDEMASLFPAPYFHIGGDEAPKKEWKKCPKCQAVIRKYNLKNEEELQGYFNNKIALYLKRKGKRLIGWNEVLKAEGLEHSVIAQYWTPLKDPRVADHLRNGGSAILSKHEAFYFDMPYAMVPLRNTYRFEPEQLGLSNRNDDILGVEGTLWTEWIMTQERLDFQTYPRLEALAETAWTPARQKNYAEFKERLVKFLPVLDKFGITYCPSHMWDPSLWRRLRVTAKFHVSDAHCEYRRALTHYKWKKKKSK